MLKVAEDDGNNVDADGVSMSVTGTSGSPSGGGGKEDAEVGYEAVAGCCVNINGAGAGVGVTGGAERREGGRRRNITSGLRCSM